MSPVGNIVFKNFHQISKDIVQNFLQSVVVVDDRAGFIVKDIVPEPFLSTPGRGVKPVADAELEPVKKEGEEAVPESLNAKELIDSFAEKGLVCAVIKPEDREEKEKLIRKTEHAAHRADIVILDWQIGVEENYGDKAVGLIKAIIDADNIYKGNSSLNRLRLIAIYTSNPDTESIIDKLKRELDIKGEQINGAELFKDALKIVIYQKSGGAIKKDPERIVNESQLTSKLITDFTNMTQGLLSNVALKSLGALRENTHRIISKFNPSLDASYISHRGLTNPPEEAQTHPIPLISSEFNDVLEDCNVIDCVSPEVIKLWIDELVEKGILMNSKVEGMTTEEINLATIDLMKYGLDAEMKSTGKPKSWLDMLEGLNGTDKEKLNELTKLLTDNNQNAKNKDADFAMLTTLKSGYSNPEPTLKLGSILRKNSQEFFVCIQPLCDSVRLTGEKCFPFLKLRVNKKTFDIVVQYGQNKIYLKVDYSPSTLVQIKFKPTGEHKEIRAVKPAAEGLYYFESVEVNIKGKPVIYELLADLKYPHAQRIINDFAYKFSRVGLMESDWLRRMAKAT